MTDQCQPPTVTNALATCSTRCRNDVKGSLREYTEIRKKSQDHDNPQGTGCCGNRKVRDDQNGSTEHCSIPKTVSGDNYTVACGEDKEQALDGTKPRSECCAKKESPLDTNEKSLQGCYEADNTQNVLRLLHLPISFERHLWPKLLSRFLLLIPSPSQACGICAITSAGCCATSEGPRCDDDCVLAYAKYDCTSSTDMSHDLTAIGDGLCGRHLQWALVKYGAMLKSAICLCKNVSSSSIVRFCARSPSATSVRQRKPTPPAGSKSASI